MRPIDVLMNEHRLIEQVLGSLESCALSLESGVTVERPLVADYARFFREFADACHHGKEEDILFRRMVERGFPTEGGPLAVMLREHTEGRARVSAIWGVGEGAGELGQPERDTFLKSATELIALLRQHILKEDRILYPMALQILTGPELDQMETDFEAFARRQAEDGTEDLLRTVADRLVSTFAPDPARMAAAAEMSHCGPA